MKTGTGTALLLFAMCAVAVSYPSFSHDASKANEPYHQTDLPELHAIVEILRGSAGPDQLAKIDQLVMSAEPQLQRLSQSAILAHRRKVELMLQDVVDRRAFEEAQANELKAGGALSKSIDEALTDLAKTLTAEQRSDFREHIKPHQD